MTQNSDNLKTLALRRSSIKGQITKFKKYLIEFDKNNVFEHLECTELTLKLGKFEMLSSRFEEVQSEIEILNPDRMDEEIDERDRIERDIIRLIATAKDLLDQNKQNLELSRRESHAHCGHGHQDIGIKLPKIEISKFDGAYFRWLEFRDTFTSLVHKNERLSPIQKFHYLISYLEGDSARIISNLEVSSDNYATAWSLLLERYDNKRLLVNHHLKSLFNIQPIHRESERSLRFLVDHVTKNLRALSSLGQPTTHWDILVIYMLSSKLDSRSLEKWEEMRNSLSEIPTLENFNKFLTDRADVLEALNRTKCDNNNTKSLSYNNNKPNSSNQAQSSFNNNQQNRYNNSLQYRPIYNQTKSFASATQDIRNKTQDFSVLLCIICSANHKIYDCPTFKAKNIQERMADVNKYKLCVNCLRQGHPTSDCRMGSCRERDCKERHNSLLHSPAQTQHTVVNFSKEGGTNMDTRQVILSTAIIEVINPNTNRCEKVRALLDCGSQSSFVTKSLQKRLGLKTSPINTINVIGIGNNSNNKVTESCVAQLNSMTTQYSVTLSCFILDELTGEIPKSPIDIKNLKIPQTIRLADPKFDQPAPIDILIGADIFWDILGCDQRSLGPNNPKLRLSKFGWLIAGPIYTTKSKSQKTVHCNHAIVSNGFQNDNFDEMLTKFWSLEEIPQKSLLSPEDKKCEELFNSTTSRLESGRFCVELPLKDSPNCLGDSYSLAKKRFIYLEKRFQKNPELKSKYLDFIHEYAALGHLSESSITKPDPSYFLCHHAVIKECSESTKLRVVFNGSEPTSSGYSLNDILLKGPHVQDSLFSILIRARQYQYVITGDVDKFYRQVYIASNQDRNLQLILWREEESLPLKTLQLNTLTYGTASASYLSTRCLWQVGEECENPLIKRIIQHDFYVDDLYTGCDDEKQLQLILNSVTDKLKSACFKLRKFKTNAPHLLKEIILGNDESLYLSESTSTLGLGWNPTSDSLHFPFKMPPKGKEITKRFIMSNAFKIFDPLGLLSPCIIQPKMMLQKLWQLKINWDEPVPQEIKELWFEFTNNMPSLSSLQIPRKVLCKSPKIIEMHVFSDASQCAYGACVYMRTIDSNNHVRVNLLCAKSKVAPIKPTTIPRLELCGALLAAKLAKSVVNSLRDSPGRIVYWCDSSVVLGWINSDPAKLKTFVANRIGEITEISTPSSWRYVPTGVNPADMISRGVNASQLRDLELWWSGPDFLVYDESEWPTLRQSVYQDLPEIKSMPLSMPESVVDFNRYSTLNKIERTFAYVKRFVHNLKNPKSKLSGHLSVKELKDSYHYLCTVAQRESFPEEYKLLSKGISLNHKSKLLSMSPFVDDNNLIRVGGRIDSSKYAYETKHPIVLDSSHHLTKLLFEREHLRNFHAGPQLLLASVRQSVWPINGRRLARQVLHRCVRCRRVQGKVLQPKMGDLPTQRINPDFPFTSVGVDFAGPFHILNRKGRGARLQKAYMCLFVCLRYKCIHLEAVSDLSKNAFMMSLRRFVARRGKPIEIFSDNGGNFTAASKELAVFLKHNADSLSNLASHEGINFVFSPSYAPHFGGIWEAGVKSAKYHMRRIMGNSHLTFEEIGTLFTQVEAILNSRPLCPLSSSPNDLLFLSPGHFLIGRQLTGMPSHNLLDAKESNLQRYARVEKLRQHFWQRWQKEYIAELQLRKKWKTNTRSLNVGDLVLLHEDHVPALSWRLGRISRLYTGSDGISRVADVTTTRGCVRRALVRLCPLMNEEG